MILSCSNKVLQGDIKLPSSKSISNRILLIQALCNSSFAINNLSEAHDTLLLQKLLQESQTITSPVYLNCEDAGTPFRFLTAFLCMQYGKEFILTGDLRLQERPIHELVLALNSIGAQIEYLEKEGFAPIKIIGKKLSGRSITIRSEISSQFISALCLIAPTIDNGLNLHLLGIAVSLPYITMTLQCMQAFGITAIHSNNTIQIQHQTYQAKNISIESDWSSACFFYAMAMMHDEVSLSLQGLSKNSIQGDANIVELANDFGLGTEFKNDICFILRKQAINTSFEKRYDLSSTPDLAIPFIVACALKYPRISIIGIQHLEWKESKRISALQTELLKINILLQYHENILSFEYLTPTPLPEIIQMKSYNDHRIAMALSMLTLCGYKIELDNTECVKKSFPNYFEEIRKIGINDQ